MCVCMDALYARVRFDDLRLNLYARSQWVDKVLTNQRCMLSATKQSISIKLATTVFFKTHILRDLDFANVYRAYPPCF